MNIFKKGPLFTCFNCEGQPGYYLEFIASGFNRTEKPICPKCKERGYTIPNGYMLKMNIPDFENLLEVMGKVTGTRPLVDRHFISLNLPNVLITRNERRAV